jgi:hypothetical protein
LRKKGRRNVAKFVEDPNEFSASGTNGKEYLAVLCLLEDAKKNFEKEGKKKSRKNSRKNRKKKSKV